MDYFDDIYFCAFYFWVRKSLLRTIRFDYYVANFYPITGFLRKSDVNVFFGGKYFVLLESWAEPNMFERF